MATTVAPYTSGQPQWEAQILSQLAANNELQGINPSALSELSKYESGYEIAGAGVNSSGYGGYFCLSQSSVYPGQSAPLGRALLLTNSPASFTEQAKVAAAELSSLLNKNGGNVNQALLSYTGGSQAEASAIEGAQTGPFQLGNSSAGGANAESDFLPGNPNATSIGGLLPSWLTSGVEGFFLDFGFVIVGLVMVIVAFVIASHAEGDKGQSSNDHLAKHAAEAAAA